MNDLPVPIESVARLSETALAVLSAGAPSAYEKLVVYGGGSMEGKRLLASLKPADLLTRPANRHDAAEALLSGLWLWHDWLDESHTLSQSISSSTGSFWHAIMHRREGDFSNAKYWYARCGGHPAHARFLTAAEPRLAASEGQAAIQRLRSGREGYGLVDLVEQAESRPAGDPLRKLAVDLQRLEWAALFEETLRSA